MTYADFIDVCRAKPRPERGEWHHIVPKSQWPGYKHRWQKGERSLWLSKSGVNDPENLVFLSYRDHIEAHWLYANETGKCWGALRFMLNETRSTVSRLADEERSNAFDEYAEMRAVALSKKRTPESRERIRLSQTGKKLSAEHCAKIRVRMSGVPRTQQAKAKLADSKRKQVFASDGSTFACAAEAAEHYGLGRCTVFRICQAGGSIKRRKNFGLSFSYSRETFSRPDASL